MAGGDPKRTWRSALGGANMATQVMSLAFLLNGYSNHGSTAPERSYRLL